MSERSVDRATVERDLRQILMHPKRFPHRKDENVEENTSRWKKESQKQWKHWTMVLLQQNGGSMEKGELHRTLLGTFTGYRPKLSEYEMLLNEMIADKSISVEGDRIQVLRLSIFDD